MLREQSKTIGAVLLASVAMMGLAGCNSSGGMRLAGVGETPTTPADGGSDGGGDGAGSGSGGSSGGGGTGGGTGSGTGGTGSGTGGTGGSTGGSTGGTGGGSSSGLLATAPVPGLVGPGGVVETGLLANTGNPSNSGPLGPVLVAAGNAVLTVEGKTPTLVQAVDRAVPGSVPIAGTVAQVLGSTGQALVDTGKGKTYLVDGLTAAVGQAVSLNVLDKAVLPGGNGTPLVGTSILSSTQNSGSLATVGLDAAGNAVRAVVTPLGTDSAAVVSAVLPSGSGGATNPMGAATGRLVGVSAGGNQVLGAVGTTPAVGVSVLSRTQTTGSLATAGVGSGGALVSASVAPVSASGSAGASVTNGALPTNGIATVTVGSTTLLNGGATPAVGASVLSPGQATGSAVTAGVLSAGNVVTTTVGNVTAPLTSVLGSGTTQGGATSTAAPAGLGGVVGGLLGRGG